MALGPAGPGLLGLLGLLGLGMLTLSWAQDVNFLQTALQLRRDDNEGVFVWQADAHVDPFYLTEMRQCLKSNLSYLELHGYGVMSCDPPKSLWQSALTASAQRNSSFVLYTGDFVRHSIRGMTEPAANATQIVREASMMTRELFPETELVFGTLGNSDAEEDYLQELTENRTRNPWFWKLGSAMYEGGAMSAKRRESFAHGGFFEARVGNLTILSLATVMYSVYHLPVGPLEEDPYLQFEWLRAQLAAAQEEGRRVWIVGHIAPGIETFSYTELWHPQYVTKYLEIVQDELLGPCIAAQLFGHVHKDEIRVLPSPPEHAGPIFLSSSVSPVYYNNPSFKLVSYDRTTGQLLNLQTFMTADLDDPAWLAAYDHASEYGLKTFSPNEIRNFTEQLLKGGELFERYAHWYASGYPNEIQHFSEKAAISNSTWKLQRRRQYLCALTIRTGADFDACAGTRARPWTLPSWEEDELRLLRLLLAWAARSESVAARQVRQMAEEGRWQELLQNYRAWLDWSLQQGTPLESSVFTS